MEETERCPKCGREISAADEAKHTASSEQRWHAACLDARQALDRAARRRFIAYAATRADA